MESKLQLSVFEAELLYNPEWILTKNAIMGKAHQLLGMVQENMVDYANSNQHLFPKEILSIPPKISRGENYRGLPWLMLDYPRFFEKENVFAIRTMFWWGNFFSSTLHLSGNFKLQFAARLTKKQHDIATAGYFISISNDPWHHHFENDNYQLVSDFTSEQFARQVNSQSFLKLSKQFPLSSWNEAIQILSEEFVRITEWLG